MFIATASIRNIFIASLGLMAFVVTASHAMAAVPAKAQPASGISISPFVQALSLQSTDINRSFSLTLTNHTSMPKTINLAVRDFGSLNDSGGILLGNGSSYNQKYGLGNWLTLSRSQLQLAPNQSQAVVVSVNNRSDLQPGGHYGAVVASVGGAAPVSGNQVAINQQLLSLLLVDKMGGEHFDLKLDDALNNGNLLRLPTIVTLSFANPGNVHVVPRGVVKIADNNNHVLVSGIINDESAFILPETSRQIVVSLPAAHPLVSRPASYHLEVDYRYDGLSRYAVKTFSLSYHSSIAYILLVALVVFGGLAGWQIWRHIKR